MPNWIVWDRTVFDIETVYKVKKTIVILNSIVWNRTVYTNKNGVSINNQQLSMYHKIKPNQTNLYDRILFLFYFIYNKVTNTSRSAEKEKNKQ